MVKLMNEKYFQNLESISNSSAEYLIPGKNYLEKKGIYYIKEIKNIKDEKIASILYKRNDKVDFSNTRIILFIMLVGFLISIFIFNYYAIKWSKRPLKLIKEVLEKGNASAIESLKNARGEFSYIGKLFEENRKQQIELEKTTKQAEESDKLKSAFLMNLSHEIRTPMNAIIGFSDLSLNKELDEIERDKYLEIIQKSGKNLVAIIDDLVEMSKIDSNLVVTKYSSIDLDNMLQTTFDAIKVTLDPKKDIDFKFVKPNKKFEKNIITDIVKLNQIISNLLTNAIKFTKYGFVILEYTIDEKEKTLNFIVKDSGRGIPDELQGNIFKRFNRIDFLFDTDNNGLGLSLAISKAYVEMLKGTISLKSELGVGSLFYVSIPLEYDNTLDNIIEKSHDKNLDLGNEEIILVAEDDNINFVLIEKILKLFNFKIVRAKDGQEAIDIFTKNKEIDLILMDIKMPNVDGYGAFKEIRAINKKIPIVAQTSFSFPEEIEKIKQAGFNDFISKPIDKEKLFLIVKKYMNK